jgi:hypothetical protein
MFRHYRVILRQPVINTLPSYTSISNAAVGNTILYNDQQMHTIISQIIALLHVSTLSCHPQTACNQYLAKAFGVIHVCASVKHKKSQRFPAYYDQRVAGTSLLFLHPLQTWRFQPRLIAHWWQNNDVSHRYSRFPAPLNVPPNLSSSFFRVNGQNLKNIDI